MLALPVADHHLIALEAQLDHAEPSLDEAGLALVGEMDRADARKSQVQAPRGHSWMPATCESNLRTVMRASVVG